MVIHVFWNQSDRFCIDGGNIAGLAEGDP